MPRKKPPEDPNAPVVPKPPRQRKKKEPANKANADGIKLDSGAPLGYDPSSGAPPMGMPMHNGVPAHLMMGGPDGMPPDGIPIPYGHHPDYYYQGGPPPPSVSNPHYAPSPHQPPPQHQFIEPEMPSSQNPYMPPHQTPGMAPHAGTPQPQPVQVIRFRHMPMMAPPWPHPYPPFLEYRLNEMNRRLYGFYIHNVNPNDHQQWWEAFSHEFFDDDAKLTIIPLNNEYSDMSRKQYTLSRLLIPRYFRTLYDGGVKEMSYVLRSEGVECMSRTQPGACALECESVLIVTRHEKPVPAQVQTECRMLIEFVPYSPSPHESSYRIKNWRIELKGCQEFIQKDINVDNETNERIRHGITNSGLPHGAIEYLKLCTILEPMQVLMRECQTDPNLNPGGALKRILFNHYTKTQQLQQQQQHLDTPQPQMNPMGPMGPLNPAPMLPQPPVEEPTNKKPPRKRVRNNAKNNAAGGNAGGGPNSKKKNAGNNNTASPAPNGPNFSMNPNGGFPMHPYGQNPAEVLIVGEPSMMGNEYGEEDERAISRIENTQYDPSLMGPPGGPPGQPHHNGPGMPMPVHSMPAPMPHRQCPPGFLGDFDMTQSGGMPPAGLWPNPMPIGASPSSGAPLAPMPIGASGEM